MNIRTLTALVPVSILAAAMAGSNAQKNKKQSHAEKISANLNIKFCVLRPGMKLLSTA